MLDENKILIGVKLIPINNGLDKSMVNEIHNIPMVKEEFLAELPEKPSLLGVKFGANESGIL